MGATSIFLNTRLPPRQPQSSIWGDLSYFSVQSELYSNGNASERAATLLDEYIKDNVESVSWDAGRANVVIPTLLDAVNPERNERQIVLCQNSVVTTGPVFLSTLVGIY